MQCDVDGVVMSQVHTPMTHAVAVFVSIMPTPVYQLETPSNHDGTMHTLQI